MEVYRVRNSADANTHAHPNSNTNADTNTDTNSDSNADTDSNSDANSNTTALISGRRRSLRWASNDASWKLDCGLRYFGGRRHSHLST